MKKVIAAIVALSLVLALCVTGFAAGLLDSNTESALKTAVHKAFTTTMWKADPDLAEKAVKNLQAAGYSKDVIAYGVTLVQEDSTMSTAIKADKLDMFNAALAAAAETPSPSVTMPATTAPTTAPSGGGDGTTSGGGDGTTSGGGSLLPDLTLPNLPDITLPDINFDELVSASDLIQRLKDAGIPASALQTVVDALHSAGAIDDTMYNEATNLINANEPTSESSNEGGIGGFLSGIVDTISGLFGGATSNDNGGDALNDDFGSGTDTPPGDTALISVVAVAAVAGAALLLTKKKK